LARRTQAERRSETRTQLLDSALDQLVATGLASFTTTEVVRRAGLSQGALFKHFPTKAELLASVAEHLFEQLRERYEVTFASLPPAKRDVAAGLELLWQQMLDPRLAAAYELYTAARTDHELGSRLAPVVRAHVERIEAFAATLVDLGEPERVRAATGLAIAAIQGVVVSQMALLDATQVARMREDLGVLAGLLVAPPARTRRRKHG
jgi:AcrR family transcriptional regulator